MLIGYARVSTSTQDLTAQRNALANAGVDPQARPARPLAARREGHRRQAHRKGMVLNIGGSTHNPHSPVGKLLFSVLGMVAEFEADLIRGRTREGMAVANAKGRLRGKKPELSKSQEAHLESLHVAGEHTTTEIAELCGVARSTVPSNELASTPRGTQLGLSVQLPRWKTR